MLNRRTHRGLDTEYLLTDISELLGAGLDMDRALHVLADRQNRMGPVTRCLRDGIRIGQPFSQALALSGFSLEIQSYVRMGECTGDLEQALCRTAQHLKTRRLRQEHLKQMTAYPTLLFLLTHVVIGLLVAVVLPGFNRMYAALGLKVAGSAEVLFAVGAWLSTWAPWLAVVLLLLTIFIWRFQHRCIAYLVHFLLSYSSTRLLTQVILSKRAMEVLAFLLHGGTDILHAFEVLGEINVSGMSREWMAVCAELSTGRTLSTILADLPQFPTLVTEMVFLAEQTGDLEQGTMRAYQYLERESSRQLERFLRYFEPATTTVLGVLIGGATLLLMMPMMDLVKTLS